MLTREEVKERPAGRGQTLSGSGDDAMRRQVQCKCNRSCMIYRDAVSPSSMDCTEVSTEGGREGGGDMVNLTIMSMAHDSLLFRFKSFLFLGSTSSKKAKMRSNQSIGATPEIRKNYILVVVVASTMQSMLGHH